MTLTLKHVIITISITVLITATATFTLSPVQAQSPITTFDFLLGDDIYDYGPILWHYGDPPMIVEDTRYGIKNPDLGSIVKCFGEPWPNLYHAGEDWYRFDQDTGEMLDLTNVPTLGNLRGEDEVWVALLFTSNGSVTTPDGVYVDNIILRMCSREPCSSGKQAERVVFGEEQAMISIKK